MTKLCASWALAALACFGFAAGQGIQKRIDVYIASDVAPGPKVQMSITSENVPIVKVVASRIDPIPWLRSNRHGPIPAPIGPPIKSWNVGVATKDNRPNPNQKDRFYSRQVNLPDLPPGVYRLDLTGDGAKTAAVVNVTHLAVLAKESPEHLLVWVTDALKGETLADAEVRVFRGDNGRLQSTGRTRGDGTLLMPLGAGNWNLVINRGHDYAGIPSNAFDSNNRLIAHFQTDRPVYRPGQTVQFKAILRLTHGIGYRVPPNADIQVELRDPKNNSIDRLKLKTNALGSVAGSFDIPQEGATGSYSLVLTWENQSAYQSVNVAEYRKPEYKVDVVPEAKRFFAGDTLLFDVSAQYYFGAPVGQAEVHYSVRRQPRYDYGNEQYGYNDGNLYPHDTYNLQPFVAEDVVHTDNNGHAIVKIKSDPRAPDSDYTISCTVTDSARRQVQGDSSVPVFASALQLGLETNVIFVPVGQLVPLTLRAEDLDGKPSSATVQIIVTHQVWNQKKNEYETILLAKSSVQVPAKGIAHASVPARAEGPIDIEAVTLDSAGRKTSSRLSVYVVGPNGPLTKEQPFPVVTTMTNHNHYAPGDVVSAHVQANTKGWPILLVAEGQDIYDYAVVPGSASWQFRTGKSMCPNLFFTACQWVKGTLMGSNTPIALPDPDDSLSVRLAPDRKEYRPGDRATFQVQTTDKHGKPVPAEVSLDVVDAAIYAVMPDNTPNLYNTFWGYRGNQVITHQAAPQELSGGAYQGVSTVAPLRQRFEDTAYWNAFVETAADGTGTATFEMPGNLTTWKAAARGVDSQTQVGDAFSSVVATRPVTLRIATPRQMAQGDSLTIIATVNNRTPLAHHFTVRLDSPGGLESANKADLAQDISVDGNGAGTVEWTLSAPDFQHQAPMLAEAICTDVGESEKADYSDALKVPVPIIPDAAASDLKVGGVVTKNVSATLELPSDTIVPATSATLRIWSGVEPSIQDSLKQVMDTYRYGVMPTADQLMVWPLLPADTDSRVLREIIAHLSKSEQSSGWGYWDSCPPDPTVTAVVLRAVALAQPTVKDIPENLAQGAEHAAEYQYTQTNLWEYRALLASALALAGSNHAGAWLDEVATKGQNLSPYAKLRLAEGYMALKQPDKARAQVDAVLPEISEGASADYLPVGEGIGWQANSMQTTAELLKDLIGLNEAADTQSKLAEWLVSPNLDDWPSTEDLAEKAIALKSYEQAHGTTEAGAGDERKIGEATIQVGGQAITAQHAKIADELLATIPASALSAGDNSISIDRQGLGEAFFEVDSRIFRPQRESSNEGIRVVRRLEAQSAAGIWHEINGAIKPGQVVRYTVLIWGDAIPDVVRLTSPLPAGFEFVDEEEDPAAETEIRDAAVVHYVLTSGAPTFYSFYMRPESEGDVDLLPATAEVLRRPSIHGQSEAQRLRVKGP